MLEEAVLPYLRELGERWRRSEISVGHEHFASNLVRGRLLGLSRGWDRGVGPRALLACVEGEQHDLPLVAFGLLLRSHGWRICYLGASTPISSVVAAAQSLEPSAIVLSGTVSGAFGDIAPRKLREVARLAPSSSREPPPTSSWPVALARRISTTTSSPQPAASAADSPEPRPISGPVRSWQRGSCDREAGAFRDLPRPQVGDQAAGSALPIPAWRTRKRGGTPRPAPICLRVGRSLRKRHSAAMPGREVESSDGCREDGGEPGAETDPRPVVLVG